MNFMERAFEELGLEQEQHSKNFQALGDLAKVTLGTIKSFYRNKQLIYFKVESNNAFRIEREGKMMLVTVINKDAYSVEQANIVPKNLSEAELGRAVLTFCGDPNG